MVVHWDAAPKGKCPDFGVREDAAHLNLCLDEGRYKLFQDMAKEGSRWLYENHTHLKLPTGFKVTSASGIGEPISSAFTLISLLR